MTEAAMRQREAPAAESSTAGGTFRWWDAPVADVLRELESTRDGLTTAEASARLTRYGPNEPASAPRLATLRQLLSFFANPLVVILLLASVVTGLLGEFINAGLIAAMVLLSVALNFVQTYRSQAAADRLREQVAPTASVRRDGAWQELPRRALVPGDIVRLSAGDLIPSDVRLLEATDLHVQQAALTGESMPAEKRADDAGTPAASPVEAACAAFLGTSVVSGAATAVVTTTGPRTAFGEIAAHLMAKPPVTEFERGVARFGALIMRTVFFLVLFVFLATIAVHVIQKTPYDPLESLLFAVALAVGLTPEFLPMITTVTLGQGALHMSRAKVIVKHLESIQNFGSMDVLCSDKTGTLTSGNMALDRALDPHGQPSDDVLRLAVLNSSFETGIKSPLDAAILKATTPDTQGYVKLGEIPFDFDRRCLSVVVARGDDRLLIAKGAPESVLARCTAYQAPDGQLPLDDAARALCERTNSDLSAAGYRVLAVATRAMPAQEAYRVADEAQLSLRGYLAFIDPPLSGVSRTVEALNQDGVRIIILTGDGELVARHVCEQVGVAAKRIVVGSELDQMSDPALAQMAEQVTVFARVSPAQKHRIILALKSRRHVVGFLGDGINDAPSLHAADVGISVASAVDVAKDAADIILLERGLDVLHAGIIEGRKAFGNVMKYLLMGTSSNFGNMFSMAGAAVFLPFLPMLPTQILLNNFLYDLAQVTIPTDYVDPTFIHKPRRWSIATIRDFMLYIGPISSIYDFMTFFVMLGVFHATPELFHTGWFVESLATQTLVIFIIRTAGNPLRSRPSRALTTTTLTVVLLGAVLPFTPVAAALGFVPLPAAYFLILLAMTATYLLLVELGKRWLMRRMIE